MQAPLTKKSEMKVLILYLIDKIGYPLDFIQLNDISTVSGLMTSFDFAECFNELLDTTNIVPMDDGTYWISEQGLHIVHELESTLLHSIRDFAYKMALKLLDFQRMGRTTEYSTSTNSDGKPVLTCAIKDGDKIVMQTTVTLENDEELERAIDGWNNHPENVYKGILALLLGDVDYLWK